MRRALIAAAAAGCLLASGCGDDEAGTGTDATVGSTTSTALTSTEATASTGDTTSEVVRCNEDPDCRVDKVHAQGTIETYFRLVEAGDLDAAWDLLAPDVQEQFGGYDTWTYGIEQRESTELASLTPAAGTPNAPAFEVEVHTVENTECDITADRTFTGTWTVEADGDGYEIASADQTLVSGPPDLEVLCATSGY